MEPFLLSCDCGCQLEQHDNEFENVDVHLVSFEHGTCFGRPDDVKPVFEFLTICSPSNSTGVTETGLLCIAGDHVADADGPRNRRFIHVLVDILNLSSDRVGNGDFRLGAPQQSGHVTSNQ